MQSAMTNMRRFGALAAGMALALTARAVEVPLTVEETAGVERALEVVSGGIPLPAGKYKDAAAFSLFDGAREVPVQVSPIVKYPDGSLHWALVSFPATLPARGKKTYTLKDQRGRAQVANPVQVRETGDLVEVSNGLVAFAVNKTRYNGFEWVKYRNAPVFKAARAAVSANGAGGPAQPLAFSHYYTGPIRTTLYIKGTIGAAAQPTYAMAITLNAGESTIHVAHNLRNGGKSAVDKFQVLEPRFNLGLAGVLQAGERGNGGGAAPAYGWQAFSGAADLLVFMRHAGRGNKGNYLVEAAGGELAIHLQPGDGVMSMDQGEHKGTDIELAFGGQVAKEALIAPLHALADGAWIAAHDSMGVGEGFATLADEILAYRNVGWSKTDDPRKLPSMAANPNLYYGWFNAHATSECDHLQGMTLGYLRTGQRGFLDEAHAWARYWRTFLLWRSDEFVYGKEGKFNTPKWGTGRCCSEGCHFYGVGLFNYALLTGDIDALEGAYDWGEMAGVAWYGPYAGKKPGNDFSAYGSRGFARSYQAVARAFDVARNAEWLPLMLHYARMATQTPGRDPRGFVIAWSSSNPGRARGSAGDKELVDRIVRDEKIEIAGAMCNHPKYGSYRPKCLSSWPEAMTSMANYVTYNALKDMPDPAVRLVAEDVLDYLIAEAQAGVKYVFDPVQKAVHPYPILDYPLPDDIYCWKGGKWNQYQAKGTDSWYTKWWPNTLAYGYALTGEQIFKTTMTECLWYGLSRDYVGAPSVAPGEAPPFARVERNTKGDWMTPTVFALGVMARPKGDEVAPAAINDLKARATGGGKVALTWTAPRDAGGGRVVRYQVKWADKPIKDFMEIDHRAEWRDIVYWNMARNVLDEPAPGAAGAAQTMTLDLAAGQTLHVAVRSFDQSHNRSPLGNVVSVAVQ